MEEINSLIIIHDIFDKWYITRKKSHNLVNVFSLLDVNVVILKDDMLRNVLLTDCKFNLFTSGGQKILSVFLPLEKQDEMNK